MKHPERLVRLWATGEISPVGRWRVEWHLRRCASCRLVRDETLDTIVALSAVLPVKGPLPPFNLESRVERKYRGRERLRIAVVLCVMVVLLAGNVALYGRVRALEGDQNQTAVAERALRSGDYQLVEMRVADRVATVAGRVFCARSGRWIYVVVDGRGTYDIWVRRGHWSRVGHTRGPVPSLYVDLPGKPTEVAVTRPGEGPAEALATAHPPTEPTPRVAPSN